MTQDNGHRSSRSARSRKVVTQPVAQEAGFQRAVVEYAQLCGWRVWHDADSRRNAPGLPDLILVRPPRLLFAELKREGGRVRPEQREWLAALAACGVETALWHPSDWPAIEQTLRR